MPWAHQASCWPTANSEDMEQMWVYESRVHQTPQPLRCLNPPPILSHAAEFIWNLVTFTIDSVNRSASNMSASARGEEARAVLIIAHPLHRHTSPLACPEQASQPALVVFLPNVQCSVQCLCKPTTCWWETAQTDCKLTATC